ncbi:MAG: KUP/HAK/KT family potassium transporter [Pelomonas sp.]|nr:KUP/HAK/KT family potassium transporter [Roseateles sp.]
MTTATARAGSPALAPTLRGQTTLALAALGIVFGDLGTSPLYALQEAFHPGRGVAPSAANVVGCTSLFLWSLIVMVSLKYVLVLMRADNQGEGGILALFALLWGRRAKAARGLPARNVWLILALVGTAMLYGDGVITPAISVLSAVEGLSVATAAFTPYVVPLTVVILIALFAVQSKGSGQVGVAFGPILAAWFVAILVLGVVSLVRTPGVLAAFNPLEGLSFFRRNGFHGFEALGAVVLCLTGGEALYADMGHFGRRPIRLAWYGLALPSLIVNYLGQAALLLRDPTLADRPFYAMVPGWALLPMVVLATLATVVASQALISAVFSLTSQAAQLGLCPRQQVRHTSAATRGQIYVPQLNWLLMAATVAIVLGFRSSDSLAAAFGLAVSTTMAITTLLFGALARWRWQWPWWRVAAVCSGFMVADLAFMGANTLKFAEGGWLPVVLGSGVFLLMYSWRTGRRQVARANDERLGLPLADFVDGLRAGPPLRVDGTAVFMCDNNRVVPTILLHHLKHNQVLHQRVILLSLETTEVPRVDAARRLEFEDLPLGFMRMSGSYGYMESPDVPALLEQASGRCKETLFDPMSTSFYLGHETLSLGPGRRWWRRGLLHLFALQRRNEVDATTHFGIPANRVVELGARLEL